VVAAGVVVSTRPATRRLLTVAKCSAQFRRGEGVWASLGAARLTPLEHGHVACDFRGVRGEPFLQSPKWPADNRARAYRRYCEKPHSSPVLGDDLGPRHRHQCGHRIPSEFGRETLTDGRLCNLISAVGDHINDGFAPPLPAQQPAMSDLMPRRPKRGLRASPSANRSFVGMDCWPRLNPAPPVRPRRV
jgi:hypothetical protein